MSWNPPYLCPEGAGPHTVCARQTPDPLCTCVCPKGARVPVSGVAERVTATPVKCCRPSRLSRTRQCVVVWCWPRRAPPGLAWLRVCSRPWGQGAGSVGSWDAASMGALVWGAMYPARLSNGDRAETTQMTGPSEESREWRSLNAESSRASCSSDGETEAQKGERFACSHGTEVQH